MSPATYSLLGFLPGLWPVFSYSYCTVSSDGCWMQGFYPWILQQVRCTMIIPISQMRKQSLANLRTLNSPTQLLNGGIKWKLSDLTLEFRLGCPSRTLDCELNLANVCGHFPPGKALLQGLMLFLSLFILHHLFTHSQRSPPIPATRDLSSCLCPQPALETPGQILYALLAPSPTVAKKPGIHQVPSTLRSVDFAPCFLSMPLETLCKSDWVQIQGRISDLSFWRDLELREQTETFLWLVESGHVDQDSRSLRIFSLQLTPPPHQIVHGRKEKAGSGWSVYREFRGILLPSLTSLIIT